MTGMENITAGICGKSSRDNSGVFRRWEVWVYSVMLILVLVGLVLVLVLACPVLVNITGLQWKRQAQSEQVSYQIAACLQHLNRKGNVHIISRIATDQREFSVTKVSKFMLRATAENKAVCWSRLRALSTCDQRRMGKHRVQCKDLTRVLYGVQTYTKCNCMHASQRAAFFCMTLAFESRLLFLIHEIKIFML